MLACWRECSLPARSFGSCASRRRRSLRWCRRTSSPSSCSSSLARVRTLIVTATPAAPAPPVVAAAVVVACAGESSLLEQRLVFSSLACSRIHERIDGRVHSVRLLIAPSFLVPACVPLFRAASLLHQTIVTAMTDSLTCGCVRVCFVYPRTWEHRQPCCKSSVPNETAVHAIRPTTKP